jgi:hypothetical protein
MAGRQPHGSTAGRAGARDDRDAGWMVDLRDIGRGDLAVAGGKGANLGELVRKASRSHPASW